MDMLKILETERLTLYQLSGEDAAFILELLNEPSFVHFIGDRRVRTLDDARAYILNGPVASYEKFGFGLYLTKRKQDGIPIGICGLVKRAALADVDIGFAFSPQFWGNGYAFEAASAVMAYGKRALGLQRIVAVATPDNVASIKLLEKLGLRFEQMVKLAEDGDALQLLA